MKRPLDGTPGCGRPRRAPLAPGAHTPRAAAGPRDPLPPRVQPRDTPAPACGRLSAQTLACVSRDRRLTRRPLRSGEGGSRAGHCGDPGTGSRARPNPGRHPSSRGAHLDEDQQLRCHSPWGLGLGRGGCGHRAAPLSCTQHDAPTYPTSLQGRTHAAQCPKAVRGGRGRAPTPSLGPALPPATHSSAEWRPHKSRSVKEQITHLP